ncbi:hypothetical protein PPK15_gp53 [Bacillus phage 000TH010]|uniref:Uncharacterized protein n=1 Tax=Bacillus phage 000TH010 TaxID=2601652 RepID=A0A5P8PHS3_9CAUD|nr:hypothetical protein PPK15_gp53 [Bacillus phage 000TH010]QFR56266.1 hypothetical protein 000TH010_53 [Bacillus phage 000TH010]
MILYKYLCKDCDTMNHIHWYFSKVTRFAAPHCCECGGKKFDQYEFKGSIEIKEEK